VTGRCQDDTVALINELVDMIRGHGPTLMAGMVLPLQARDVYLAPVERPEGIVLTAVSLYGPRATALQAIWADDDGCLPWEQEVPDTLTQPLYGTPPGLKPAGTAKPGAPASFPREHPGQLVRSCQWPRAIHSSSCGASAPMLVESPCPVFTLVSAGSVSRRDLMESMMVSKLE
jgi:hypothetical protein